MPVYNSGYGFAAVDSTNDRGCRGRPLYGTCFMELPAKHDDFFDPRSQYYPKVFKRTSKQIVTKIMTVVERDSKRLLNLLKRFHFAL